MNRLLRVVLEPTERIQADHYRSYAFLSIGTLSAVFVHLLYSAVFAAFGVVELVFVNFFSIPAYLIAFALNRRGFHFISALIAAIELCIHQTFAVYYIGWDAGFQMYLLVVPMAIFACPGRRLRLKMPSVALALGFYLALGAWDAGSAPAYNLGQDVLMWANYINIITVFALISLFTFNYSKAAETAESGLREQWNRAESLLHNILPVPIANRLKARGGVIADGFAEASVLFADIVNFTQLSETVTPERLVALLNDIFSEFDEMVTQQGIEKIKTIGDAYMVAAGIPEPRPGHAAALVRLGLDMQKAIKAKGDQLGLPLELRIGINSGPVVAGVIGKKKFIYDLWGDSVNTASRMESHGVAGRVQITEATLNHLNGAFEVEARGTIQVKGKGSLPVYLVKE